MSLDANSRSASNGNVPSPLEMEMKRKFDKLFYDNAKVERCARNASRRLGEDRTESILHSAYHCCLSRFFDGKFVFQTDSRTFRYVCGVIRNKGKEKLRQKIKISGRERSWDEYSSDEEYDLQATLPDPKTLSPTELAERREELDLFNLALEDTFRSFNDDKFRQIYYLRQQGLKIKAIADQVGLSPNVVSKRYYKIVAKCNFRFSSQKFFRSLFLNLDFREAARDAKWSVEKARSIYGEIEEKWSKISQEQLIPSPSDVCNVDADLVKRCSELCDLIFFEWFDKLSCVRTIRRNPQNRQPFGKLGIGS